MLDRPPKTFRTERSEVIKRFNKRGVTPLVATLLLISFSIGLGAIVMSWGQHYIEEKAEFITAAQAAPLGCDPVLVSLISIGASQQLCIAPLARTVRAFIENGPDVVIDNLQARVVGTEGVDTVEQILSTPLGRAASATASFAYNAVGQVRQIKLTPYLTVNDKRTYCQNKAIVVEEPLKQCSES